MERQMLRFQSSVIKFIAGAIVLLAAAGAEGADLVVADAHNIALEPGQLVDGNRPLLLRDDQRLTLIAKDGRTIRLRGPYNGRPGTAEAAHTTTLFEGIAALRTEKAPRLNQAGVVRSPSLIPELQKGPRSPAP
jgi:hypothetical protein